MNTRWTIRRPAGAARQKLLDAALTLIRTKGYEATTVDDICQGAAVAKGAFFHHFKSKEALAIAAAGWDSPIVSTDYRTIPIKIKPVNAPHQTGLLGD